MKEEELNIYDIPISKITKDFLAYINLMQSLDIEIAGEFLLMASELMRIKARMLIPSVNEYGEEIEEDPRMVLVRKLLEYKRFKDISQEFSNLEDEARKRFFRGFFDEDPKESDIDILKDPSLKNLTIFNLIKGYKVAISNIRPEVVHPIELLNTTPETQREFLQNFFIERSEIDFYELIMNMDEKMLVICTFLAILQLALEGFLRIDINGNDISKFKLVKVA